MSVLADPLMSLLASAVAFTLLAIAIAAVLVVVERRKIRTRRGR